MLSHDERSTVWVVPVHVVDDTHHRAKAESFGKELNETTEQMVGRVAVSHKQRK